MTIEVVEPTVDPAVAVPDVQPPVATATMKTIHVYVCPTPGCPDFFGSTTMGALHHQFTGPMTENKPALLASTGSTARHTRAACPTCRIRGVHVERVLVTTRISVPTTGPATPDLPRYHV